VNIIEDYIILGGNDFLSMHATNIAKILDLVVGNVNDKGLLSVLPVVDILIQVCYSQLINCYFQYIIFLLKSYSFWMKIEKERNDNSIEYIIDRL
jgi:hypothetical protein